LGDEAPGIAVVGGFPPKLSLWQVQALWLPELVAYYNARTEIPFAKIAT
jgi:hypothetical protein